MLILQAQEFSLLVVTNKLSMYRNNSAETLLERSRMTTQNIIRLPQVKQRTGLSRSTIYGLIKSGLFKAPISLGARAVGWLDSDVDEFIEERVKASRKPA